MAKYLVTGGAGFIGSHIVEEILVRGGKVRVIDNLSTGKIENLEPFLKKIEFLEGDITNPQDVRKAVTGIDYVVHQAAYLNVAGSVENPGLVNDINVGGTLNTVTSISAAVCLPYSIRATNGLQFVQGIYRFPIPENHCNNSFSC